LRWRFVPNDAGSLITSCSHDGPSFPSASFSRQSAGARSMRMRDAAKLHGAAIANAQDYH
jgi:hypothetical protein